MTKGIDRQSRPADRRTRGRTNRRTDRLEQGRGEEPGGSTCRLGLPLQRRMIDAPKTSRRVPLPPEPTNSTSVEPGWSHNRTAKQADKQTYVDIHITGSENWTYGYIGRPTTSHYRQIARMISLIQKDRKTGSHMHI